MEFNQSFIKETKSVSTRNTQKMKSVDFDQTEKNKEKFSRMGIFRNERTLGWRGFFEATKGLFRTGIFWRWVGNAFLYFNLNKFQIREGKLFPNFFLIFKGFFKV